ncbi:MAG: multidrug efflux MFS transporter [Streptomyces sp.]|nr:multidrug efflux MFS transporter [Streptomyces sp.]
MSDRSSQPPAAPDSPDSPDPAAGPARAPTRLDAALLRLAAIVVVGALTSMLDMTMVTVALAGLARDFDASVAVIQWVSTGYLLAIAMVIPVTGWAIERFGAKHVWLFALTVFTAGSALCGTAWSAGSLIAFRVLQGVGGGMIVPLSMAILAQAAGPERRGRVMSVVAIPAQLAPIAGPPLGGLLVEGPGWRWIFYVNVPIGLLAGLLAWRGIPRASRPAAAGSSPDVVGLALLSPALAALTYGLYRTSVPFTAAGAVLLAVFTLHALRTHGTPVVDPRLFARRPFAAASALNFLSRMSIFGAMILMPLYYQQVRGHSALTAGLLLIPQSLGTMAALPLVGRVTDRVGARPVVLAGIAAALPAALVCARMGADTSELLLSAALFVWGLATAAATVPVMAAAYHGLEPAAIPRATSAITTVQTVGASVGAAVLGTILAHRTADRPGAPAEAFADTFWWVVAFCALALVPALLLPRTPRAPHDKSRS